MRVSERFKLIPILEPVDAEAGIDGQSVNMGLLHEICFPICFGAMTGDPVLKFYVGATDGTKTTAVAFSYRISSGLFKAASADLYGAVTAVASTGLTVDDTTMKDHTLVVEFDSQAIPDATPWLTVELSAASSVCLVSCTAIGEPRFASNSGTTIV